MLIPARLKLLGLVSVTAYALILAFCPKAIGQGLRVEQSDLPKLIEAAQKAGIGIQYDQTVTDERATGTGAGGKADGAELKQQIDSSAPGATLPGGGSASGGDAKTRTTATAPPPGLWASPWFWCAVACELIAGACVIVPIVLPMLLPAGFVIGRKIPIGFALAGAAFFVAAYSEALLVISLIAAAVCMAGPWLLTELHRLKDARRTVNEEAEAEAAHDELHQRSAAEIKTLKAENAAQASAFNELCEAVMLSDSARKAIFEHLDSHADDEDEARIRAGLKRNAPNPTG